MDSLRNLDINIIIIIIMNVILITMCITCNVCSLKLELCLSGLHVSKWSQVSHVCFLSTLSDWDNVCVHGEAVSCLAHHNLKKM